MKGTTMTNKRLAVMLAAVLALLIGGGAVFTLAQGKTAPTPTTTAAPAAAEPELPYPEGGGTLILRVNPEFAIHYDAQGKVVGVDELNDDARAMALDLASYEGQECRAAVSALIAKIKDAGYIVEEVENEGGNTINLEVEDGSALPASDFLRNIVHDSQSYVVSQNLRAPMEVTGTSNYGWTDYGDTDYGPDNDGVTDYYDSDYGALNDGVTDYTSDYGESVAATTTVPSTGGGSGGAGSGGGTGGASSGGASSTSSSGGGSTAAATPAPAPVQTTPAPAPAPTPAPAPAPAPSGGGGNSGYSGYDDGGNSGYSNYDDGGNSGYSSYDD